jgi:hypothetical protein
MKTMMLFLGALGGSEVLLRSCFYLVVEKFQN